MRIVVIKHTKPDSVHAPPPPRQGFVGSLVTKTVKTYDVCKDSALVVAVDEKKYTYWV